jgi:hypothetical protein
MECSFCGRLFGSEVELARHMKDEHDVDTEDGPPTDREAE